MSRIPGQENAAVTVSFGQQQIMPPACHMKHPDFTRKTDQTGNHRFEIGVFGQVGMQSEFLPVTLDHDQRSMRIEKGIMTPAPIVELVEQVGRIKHHLPQLADVALALQRDAAPLADRTHPAVASGEIARTERMRAPFRTGGPGGDLIIILLEIRDLAIIANGHVRRALGDLLQHRLQPVLRDQLIWFKRQGTIMTGADAFAPLRD